LQLNQLEQVQHDVAALLEHGLNPPAPLPAPAEAKSAPAGPAADAPAPAASEEPKTY
jgi:ribosomal protein L12E/L44/L45/RPP1/RPP2